MEEFSEDMLQWKQSHKIVATLLERRQHLKSSQSKDWIRFAKLTDEQDHAYSTWLTKKCQIQEAISNDERKVKIQSLVKTAEIESDRYCELQNQRIALLKPNSDAVKEKESKSSMPQMQNGKFILQRQKKVTLTIDMSSSPTQSSQTTN